MAGPYGGPSQSGPEFGYSPDGAGPYPGQGPPPGLSEQRDRLAGSRRDHMRNPNTWPDRNPLQPSSGDDGMPPLDSIPFGVRPLAPEMAGNRKFIPLCQADNDTPQNNICLPLQEGENIFLLDEGIRGPPPPRNGFNGPQELGYGNPYYYNSGFQPYLKLIYNPSAATKISFEYGLTTYLPSFLKAEETDPNKESDMADGMKAFPKI
ncbi:hypothetical protein UPYG_G00041320 [Umbra pygmaea]|uniref:Uncharacterized protein n=1 Tax=Umbra pygmaea TaxID=75934 RepID=A0ABD0Y3N8_UMBPY